MTWRIKMNHVLKSLVVVLAVSLGVTSLKAADVDFFMPEDTAIVSSTNFKQLIASPLFKKYALEHVRKALNDQEQVKGILDDLGFDPLTDLDRLISAGPGGTESEKGVVIVHGKFDLEKFKAKGEEAAKADGDSLKIIKVGQAIIYEVNHPSVPATIYVALPNATTLIASPAKDYVVDALRRTEKPKLKNAEFQALLEKMDQSQTFSIAALSSAVKDSGPLAGGIGKQIMENLDAVGGGITVSDEITIAVAGSTKSAETAKDLAEKVNDGINKGIGLLALFASQEKKLNPLVDLLKTVKTQAKDKAVVLKVTVPAEMIEKAIKDNQNP